MVPQSIVVLCGGGRGVKKYTKKYMFPQIKIYGPGGMMSS